VCCANSDACPEKNNKEYICSDTYNNTAYAVAAMCPTKESSCGTKRMY